MSKSKLASEAEQTALANSRPGETEFTVPSNGEPRDTSAVVGVASTNATDGALDELDKKILGQLEAAIRKSGKQIKLADFEVRSVKELVGYPGGSYINWTLVFTSKMTRKVLRSDALLAPRGDFYVLMNELESICR